MGGEAEGGRAGARYPTHDDTAVMDGAPGVVARQADGVHGVVARQADGAPSVAAQVTAKRVIDARGMVVAPGFIDMLGQSERSVLREPHVPSKIFQGITTEITGEGNSIAPRTDKMLAAGRRAGPACDGVSFVCGLLQAAGGGWVGDQSGELCRRDYGAADGAGGGRPRAYCGRAGRDAGDRAAGDAGWGDGAFDFADVCSCSVCEDRGADCAGGEAAEWEGSMRRICGRRRMGFMRRWTRRSGLRARRRSRWRSFT